RVPLAPESDLGDYKSIRMDYEWKGVDQKDIDAAMEDMRQLYATTENVERPLELGDYDLLDVKSEPPELHRVGFATFVREEDRDSGWPYAGFAREVGGLEGGESR